MFSADMYDHYTRTTYGTAINEGRIRTFERPKYWGMRITARVGYNERRTRLSSVVGGSFRLSAAATERKMSVLKNLKVKVKLNVDKSQHIPGSIHMEGYDFWRENILVG